MKRFIVLLLFLVQYSLFSQENQFFEKPPLFSGCADLSLQSQQKCFDQTVFKLIHENFKVPQKIIDENYQGEAVILFEVDSVGQFKVIYVDAMYEELKSETKRIFSKFPQISPGTYNGKPTYKQYSIKVKIPLVDQVVTTIDLRKDNEISELEKSAKSEIDSVNNSLEPFDDKNAFKSVKCSICSFRLFKI
jgi:hypothetical protein